MPLAAVMLQGLFTSLAAFFLKWFGTKIATAAAALSAFSILVIAFAVAVAATMNAVLAMVPASGYTASIMLFIPPSTPALCALIFTVDGAVFIYRWNKENIRLAAMSS